MYTFVRAAPQSLRVKVPHFIKQFSGFTPTASAEKKNHSEKEVKIQNNNSSEDGQSHQTKVSNA